MPGDVTTVRVPVVKTRLWRVPEFMNRLVQQRWQGSAFFWDIDKCILGSSDVHAPNRLSGRMLYEFVLSLERGIRHAFVTGAHFELQAQRVMEPIVEYLRAKGKLHLLRNIALSANRGGALCVYNENGELDQDAFNAHIGKYGIDRTDWPVLQRIYAEVIEEYWQDFQGNREGYLKRHPDFEFTKPRIEERGFAQTGIKPFPGIKKLEEIILRILAKLPPELAAKYSFVPGGGTTVDVNRRGVNKPLGIRVLCEHFGIEWPTNPVSMEAIERGEVVPIFGGGDEFWVKARYDGKPLVGGDTPMLEVPHLVALAVNPDQTTVDSLLSLGLGGKAKRIFPLGSGPEASREFIIWANRGEPAEHLLVPVEEKTTLSIPDPFMDFLKRAPQEGIIALSGSILKGFRYGKEMQIALDPAIVEVLKLLKKGIPIVVSTGGNYEERVKPIMEVLWRVIEEQSLSHSILRNLMFYSNGGAVKIGFNPYNGKPLLDEEYNRRHQIPKGDFARLASILEGFAATYIGDSSIMAQHEVEFPEKPPQVEQRYKRSQLSLLPLLEAERGRLVSRFLQLVEDQLGGKYGVHVGGYAMDMTRAEVTKALALDDAAQYFGRTSFAYLGGELAFVYDDQTGQIIPKIDMEIFRATRARIVTAIALNHNQQSIPEHPLIVPGGSGLPALNIWLATINKILEGKV